MSPKAKDETPAESPDDLTGPSPDQPSEDTPPSEDPNSGQDPAPDVDGDVEVEDEPEVVEDEIVEDEAEYREVFGVGDGMPFPTYDEAVEYGKSKGIPQFSIVKAFVREDHLSDLIGNALVRQTVRGGEDAGPLTNIGGITPPT